VGIFPILKEYNVVNTLLSTVKPKLPASSLPCLVAGNPATPDPVVSANQSSDCSGALSSFPAPSGKVSIWEAKPGMSDLEKGDRRNPWPR
jgi:hypothetical protein